MRNGYIVDVLTSVDFQENVKIVQRVIEIFNGVTYRGDFKTSSFRKASEKVFSLWRKYQNQSNDLMQSLVKLGMNNLDGFQIRKDINESSKCKSQNWMETEYNENVLEYWRLPKNIYGRTKERRCFRMW